MGVKYVDDFDFSKGFGFTGSSVGRHDPRSHPDTGDAYGDRKALDKGEPSATNMRKGGHVKKAAGGSMGSVGDTVSKRGMMPDERQNYDVLRAKRWPAEPDKGLPGGRLDRGEARTEATNPVGRLTDDTTDSPAQGSSPYRKGGHVRKADGGAVNLEGTHVDDGERRGGAIKMAQGGRAKRYADGGGADAPVYPPEQLPGAPTVKPKAQVVPAQSRESAAYQQGLLHGARLGAKMATQHVLGSAAKAQQSRMAPGAPAAPAAPPMAPPMPAGPPAGAAPPMARGGHITASQRHALPRGDFALSGERYPIDTPGRARSALSRASANASSAQQKTIKAAVHRKYPKIGQEK